MTTIQILCINDFHAELQETEAAPGCAKLAYAVKEYLGQHKNTVVVFGGDNYKGDPISDYSDGKPVNALIRSLHAPVSVLGNHEFDYPPDRMLRWQEDGGFRFLAANLVDTETNQRPPFAKPYLFLNFGDINVAVIGLATQEALDTKMHLEEIRRLRITDGVSCAAHWASFLKAGKDRSGVPDAIIALTHFGLKYDADGQVIGDEMQRLCHAAIPIDGAFAAHWHQFMALELNGVPIAQGGSRGQGFAVLSLTFDEQKQLASVVPSYVNLVGRISELQADEEVQKVYETSYKEAMQCLGETVGTAAAPMWHRDPKTNEAPYQGSAFSSLVLQAIMRYTECKIGLFYSGWLGNGFDRGKITKYDLCRNLRYNGGVVVMKLSGKALLQNLKTGVRNLRTDSLSPLAVAGICITINPDLPAGKRLIDAKLCDGAAILPDATYTVAVDGGIAENTMGFDFSTATDRIYFEHSILDCLEQEIRRIQTVNIPQPSNIAIVEEDGTWK